MTHLLLRRLESNPKRARLQIASFARTVTDGALSVKNPSSCASALRRLDVIGRAIGPKISSVRCEVLLTVASLICFVVHCCARLITTLCKTLPHQISRVWDHGAVRTLQRYAAVAVCEVGLRVKDEGQVVSFLMKIEMSLHWHLLAMTTAMHENQRWTTTSRVKGFLTCLNVHCVQVVKHHPLLIYSVLLFRNAVRLRSLPLDLSAPALLATFRRLAASLIQQHESTTSALTRCIRKVLPMRSSEPLMLPTVAHALQMCEWNSTRCPPGQIQCGLLVLEIVNGRSISSFNFRAPRNALCSFLQVASGSIGAAVTDPSARIYLKEPSIVSTVRGLLHEVCHQCLSGGVTADQLLALPNDAQRIAAIRRTACDLPATIAFKQPGHIIGIHWSIRTAAATLCSI